ncbi:DUF2501 domain-containing protein [Paraburkholderia kururiensis]|uniref:DUF2501 domain-containing protein n=1 Tax=Paraburkholderia kururiensis TaxID=984307 RepID=UPI0039A544B1
MNTKKLICRSALVASLAVALPWSTAQAQLGNFLNQAGGAAASGSGAGSGLSGLGSLAGGLTGGGTSLMPGSLGNVAGLLQYCVQNNYLSANGTSSVQNALMGKLGGNPSSSPGYTSGTSGLLDAGNGKTLDLSGDGVKQALAKQVCDRVLAQAKSMF